MTPARKLHLGPVLRVPLALQLTHIALSCAWNVAGLWRVAHGQAPLGPTASAVAIGVMLALAAALVHGARSRPAWYAAASLAMVLFLTVPLSGAILLEPTRWPAPAWRWGGMVLNSVGLLAGIWGLLRWRQTKNLKKTTTHGDDTP